MFEPAAAPSLLVRLDHGLKTLGRPLIIASDGDGTLWRGDIGEALFLHALGRSLLKPAAAEALASEMRDFAVTSSGSDSNTMGRALLDAFEAGRYPDERAFAMMAWAFAGWHESELGALCDEVLDNFGFGGACHDWTLNLVAWAADNAVPFYVVSASPLAIVERAARRMGLASNRVVAMQSLLVDRVLQPKLALEATYGAGKQKRLRDIDSSPLLCALGDSAFDAALLKDAFIAAAVGPAIALRGMLDSHPRAIHLVETPA